MCERVSTNLSLRSERVLDLPLLQHQESAMTCARPQKGVPCHVSLALERSLHPPRCVLPPMHTLLSLAPTRLPREDAPNDLPPCPRGRTAARQGLARSQARHSSHRCRTTHDSRRFGQTNKDQRQRNENSRWYVRGRLEGAGGGLRQHRRVLIVRCPLPALQGKGRG